MEDPTTGIEIFMEHVLPRNILEWFEIGEVKDLKGTLEVELREKYERPVGYEGKKLESRGLKLTTLQDYPIRGKRVLLRIYRRRWKLEGQKELLIRPLKIKEENSEFVAEFANFLKRDGLNEVLLESALSGNFFESISQPLKRIIKRSGVVFGKQKR